MDDPRRDELPDPRVHEAARARFAEAMATVEAAKAALHLLYDADATNNDIVREYEAALVEAGGAKVRRRKRDVREPRLVGTITIPGRDVLDYAYAEKVIGAERFEQIRAPFKARAEAAHEAARAAEKVAEEAARAAAVPGVLRRQPGNWLVLGVTWSSTYSSQTDPHGYARNAAELNADVARFHGVEVRVEQRDVQRGRSVGPFGGPWMSANYYTEVAVAEPLDVECLKRIGGPTLREQVRMCWARGVNPRVYNPFLPVGYEEKVGIDYFGRDLRKANG
jgi:hypothetical protein